MAGLPCIVEVALNGVTGKQANPHVPRTPPEITADALACIEAGATIVHNHNDEPMWVEDGVHSAAPYTEAWREIKLKHPDVLLYATQASGGPGIGIEARWAHHVELARQGLTNVGLVDPGSVSLGGDGVYINSHADARYMVERCADLALIASISIFDPSFLRVALGFHEQGLLASGAIVKLYFGGALPFGLPPTRTSLDAYLEMLAGTGLEWLVAVLGGDLIETPIAGEALERGGHLRVGLEDYAGDRTPTNRQLVEAAVEAIWAAGRRPATAQETRTLLER